MRVWYSGCAPRCQRGKTSSILVARTCLNECLFGSVFRMVRKQLGKLSWGNSHASSTLAASALFLRIISQ